MARRKALRLIIEPTKKGASVSVVTPNGRLFSKTAVRFGPSYEATIESWKETASFLRATYGAVQVCDFRAA